MIWRANWSFYITEEIKPYSYFYMLTMPKLYHRLCSPGMNSLSTEFLYFRMFFIWNSPNDWSFFCSNLSKVYRLYERITNRTAQIYCIQRIEANGVQAKRKVRTVWSSGQFCQKVLDDPISPSQMAVLTLTHHLSTVILSR